MKILNRKLYLISYILNLKSKAVWASLVVLAITLPIIYIALNRPSEAKAAWWNGEFKHRTAYSFTATSAVTIERKVKIDVDTATLITAGKMQSDCDDVRFTDAGGQLLDYFIDTNTAGCNNASTDFYIKLKDIKSGGNLVYLYYGNANAARTEPGGRKNDFFAQGTEGVGLKGYWKLNESTADGCVGGSNDACDSGLGYDGAWTNSPTPVAAKLSNGLQFNGSTNYVSLGTNTIGPVLNGASQVSVSAWTYQTAYDVTSAALTDVVSVTVINGTSHGAALYTENATGTPRINCTARSVGSEAREDLLYAHPGLNQWLHLVCVIDYTNDALYLYVNGVLVRSSSVTFNNTTYTQGTPTTRVDTISETGNGEFTGTIDNVQIHKRALTADEVLAMYNGGHGAEMPVPFTFTPSSGPTASSEETTSGSVAYWNFDEGTGQGVQDSTTHRNHGTLGATSSSSSDDPTWIEEGRCVSGKCLQFDGSADYVNVAPDVNGIKSIGFWVKPITTTEYFVDLDGGTTYISATSGTISATGFTSPTIYVNGVVSSTLTANKWQYIEVTSATAVNGTVLTLGKISTNYLEGFLDEPKIYPYARSAAEVKADFSAGSAVLGAQDQKDFLSDGLVGYWKMDETAANGCTGGVNDSCDSSGNGKDGAWNGNATAATGKFGNGVTFDGSGDYIQSASNLGISGAATRTVAFWAKWDGVNDGPMVSIGSTSSLALFAPMILGGTYYFNGFSGAGDVGTGISANTAWHFHVVTYDGTRLNWYLDGTKIVNDTALTLSTIDNTFRVGARQDGAYYFGGIVDEVRIFNRALSSDDARALYTWAPGPVGYWNFDQGSGQSATDISGNANPGTLGSGASVGTDDPAWTTGKFGGGLNFDGSNDYVDVGDPSSGIFDMGITSSFSMEAWVKTSDMTNADKMIANFAGNCSTVELGFGLSSTGVVRARARDSNNSPGDSYVATGTTAVNDGKWHHVSAVRDTLADVWRVYVDGKLEASATDSTTGNFTLASNSIYFGRRPTCGSAEFYTGVLDEMKFYNYARSSQQMVEDMNASHPSAGSPVGSQVLKYGFDEQAGTAAQNSIAGVGIANGSVSGASWRTKKDCKVNGCLDFDGSNDVVTVTNVDPIDLNVNLASGFTMSAWVFPDSDGEADTGQIFQKGTTTYCRTDTQSGTSTDLECSIDLATTDATVNVSGGLTIGQWSHVAVTYADDSDDEITVYINGVLRGTSTNGVGAPAADTNNLLIGGTTTANFDGKIDEFNIYNSELSVDQIRVDMNDNAALSFSVLGASESADLADGPGDPPTLLMTLDENTGTTTNSTSGTFTGTLTGGPTWAPVTNAPPHAHGLANTAVSFDGSNDFIDIGTGPTSVKSVGFWVYPTTTTEYFIDLNGTAYIWANAGTVTATGFTSPTIYVNGKVSSTITANIWQHIEVTTATGLNASDLDIGRLEGTDNLSGKIDYVVTYDYARTAAQVAYDYNRGAPVGHWRLDECQGSTANDASGNGNHGTITIGATGTEDTVGTCATSSTAWGSGATGKYSASLDFDGTDDGISVTDNAALRVTNNFAVSAWFKIPTTVVGSFPGIVSKNDDTGFVIWYTTSGSNILDARIGGTQIISESGGSLVVARNEWHHVVITYDDVTKKLYLDGKLRGSVTNSTDADTSTANLVIGRWNMASRYFTGQIDDVRIYNYALSAAQVRKVFNEGSAVRYGANN